MFTFRKKPKPNALYLHNSLTGEKELFEPHKAGKPVTLYTCGPTVYNDVQIGNLSSFLVADIVKRVLLASGYTVKHTMNFTDFGHLTDDGDAGEDKIMKGMRAAGLSIDVASMREFTTQFITSIKEDFDAMNFLPPTTYARASDFVVQQIKLIETLEQKGYTYDTSDGTYFSIDAFPRYGQLGNIDLDKLKAGARVEINPEKKNPADFALWKKGELGWDSKWGKGFPGWHIECTAMAFATLGKQIDIHTGGEDLQYTHHNAEIAQAEAASGRPFVKYWLHKAHITFNNEKIAKSTGNSITLADLINSGFSAADYRYWLLTSHYRTGANFSFEALTAAAKARRRLMQFVTTDLSGIIATSPAPTYETVFFAAVNDDLGTPQAIALLWELIKDDSIKPGAKLATLQLFDSVLGLGIDDMLEAQPEEIAESLPEEIAALATARAAARTAKDWPEADRLRDELLAHGYAVVDNSDGQHITAAKRE